MKTKKSKKNKKGGVFIFFALLMPILIAITSLSIDVWHLYFIRNQMQIAADAAALAAVISMSKVAPGDTIAAISSAKTLSQLNHFTDGANQTTVTVSIPPGDPYNTSPIYANDSHFARVVISQSVSLFFGTVMGIPSKMVSVNAVAGLPPIPLTILTTATSGSGSLNQTGNGSITAIGGPIAVNSNSSTALTNGSVITANTFYIVGGYSGSLNGTINQNTRTLVNDPFAGYSLPQPPFICNYTNYSANNATLSPGTYCGGISITGSGSTTFNPGTYILYGGGLSISGSGAVNGTGVVFYNTGTSGGTNSYGSISITGSGRINLSAPTSGPYPGMLFMQDPLNTKSASINGSGSNSFAGNLYLPNASLTITGSGTMNVPIGVLVIKNLKKTGSSVISVSNQYGGLNHIALYE